MKTSLVVAAAIFAAMCSVVANGESVNRNPVADKEAQQRHDATAGETQRERHPALRNGDNSDHRTDANAKADKSGSEPQPWTHGDYIQIALLIVTFLYFITTLLILISMNRSLTATRDVNAMTREANAITRRNLEITETSFRIAHSASVHVASVALRPRHIGDLTTTVTFINSGAGTAYDVLVTLARVQTRAPEELRLVDLTPPMWAGYRRSGILPPQGTFGLDTQPQTPDEIDMQALASGSIRLYVGGVVLYHDEFNTWTEYRYGARFEQNGWIFVDERVRRNIDPGSWVTVPQQQA